MAKKEVTSSKAASAASKVLRDKDSTKAEKTAAASTLSQTKAPAKVTGSKAGAAASKTLRTESSSRAAKTSSGSALTQRPSKKG